MIPVITRIALRYLAAMLVTRGLLGADDAAMLSGDPDLQMLIETGIGFAIMAGTEGWHWLSARFGLYR
jgi:hypothetical protein